MVMPTKKGGLELTAGVRQLRALRTAAKSLSNRKGAPTMTLLIFAVRSTCWFAASTQCGAFGK
jgi:hypothetical protein